MRLAQAAGLDLAEAERRLAANAVKSLGGYRALKDRINDLPPAFRKAALAMRDLERQNSASLRKISNDARNVGRILVAVFAGAAVRNAIQDYADSSETARAEVDKMASSFRALNVEIGYVATQFLSGLTPAAESASAAFEDNRDGIAQLAENFRLGTSFSVSFAQSLYQTRDASQAFALAIGEARQEFELLNRTHGPTNAVENISNFDVGDLAAFASSVHPTLEALEEAQKEAARAAERHAEAVNELRERLQPTQTAVAAFERDLQLAREAGVDMTQAERILAAEAIEAAGGIDALGRAMKDLPEPIRAAAQALREFEAAKKTKDAANLAAAQQKELDLAKQEDEREAARQRRTDEINRAMEQRAARVREVADAWVDAARGVGDLGSAFESILIQILKTRAIEPFIENVFGKILGSPASGSKGGKTSGKGGGGFLAGLLGSLFGGFRADGGRVSANRMYMIGERGRELFIPDQSGTIAPNTSSGATVVQNFNGNVGDYHRSRRQLRQDARRVIA
jgi:DNA repair exonuclease SbcCD ATPase subunit